MSFTGTPLHRLQQALGNKKGKQEVAVFAGDFIDCGGSAPELKALKPGETVSVPASEVIKLCEAQAKLQSRQQESNQKESAKALKDNAELQEMVQLQGEENAKLKSELEELKKKPAA